MTPNISMSSSMKGGLGRSLTRAFSGDSLFMVTYTCQKEKGLVAFCNEFPGKIIKLNLKAGESVICQRDAFMAAQDGVDLKPEFTKKLKAGLLGGEGFILQKITGPGEAFLEISGELTEYDLAAGQVLKINPGYIGAFEPSVKYSISMVKGVRNIIFGGEGLFLATLTGPGKVWLQSTNIDNIASKIGERLKVKKK